MSVEINCPSIAGSQRTIYDKVIPTVQGAYNYIIVNELREKLLNHSAFRLFSSLLVVKS